MGKTLLRNVIRHTDAHNKIQEETDMWKMREWELQTPQRKHVPAASSMRGHMHCDRESNPSKPISRSRVSEHDDREARYWTKQLYEFEDKDPDRWGHSGFKELYPEEFNSDSGSSDSQKTISNNVKKSKSGKEAKLSKHKKKSSHKKKKKKKTKEESKPVKAECRSSECNESGAVKDTRRKRTKSRHKNKKSMKRCRDSDSSSVDSDSEKDKETHSSRRKKRKQASHKPSDSEPDSEENRRKDWRAAGEENSDGSSGD
uniref:NKAP domain containing 1 n=1 Tax=Knipowitschia caucasica TaxID=637954 RepID=A0AAV2J4A8_KNICA